MKSKLGFSDPEVYSMYCDHRTYLGVARETGLSRSGVRYIVRRFLGEIHYKLNRVQKKKVSDEILLQNFRKVKSIDGAARLSGIAQCSARTRLLKLTDRLREPRKYNPNPKGKYLGTLINTQNYT